MSGPPQSVALISLLQYITGAGNRLAEGKRSSRHNRVIERHDGRQEGRGEVIKHATSLVLRARHSRLQRNRIWWQATGVHCVDGFWHL